MSNAKRRHRRRRRTRKRDAARASWLRHRLGSRLESLFDELGERAELDALIIERWGHLF